MEVVLALASGCARCPCADVAERTTPASRHGRRQDLEKCEEVPHEITLFKVACSSSITWGSSVFHKSLKRGQRAPVAFPHPWRIPGELREGHQDRRVEVGESSVMNLRPQTHQSRPPGDGPGTPSNRCALARPPDMSGRSPSVPIRGRTLPYITFSELEHVCLTHANQAFSAYDMTIEVPRASVEQIMMTRARLDTAPTRRSTPIRTSVRVTLPR